MRKKSENARLKAVERRAKWFEKKAKKEGSFEWWAKEQIDENFADDEYSEAYALFYDLLTNSYPFSEPSLSEDAMDVVRDKYGFDWAELDLMLDLMNEASNKFPNDVSSGDREEERTSGK